jgi:hypothetical protein
MLTIYVLGRKKNCAPPLVSHMCTVHVHGCRNNLCGYARRFFFIFFFFLNNKKSHDKDDYSFLLLPLLPYYRIKNNLNLSEPRQMSGGVVPCAHHDRPAVVEGTVI